MAWHKQQWFGFFFVPKLRLGSHNLRGRVCLLCLYSLLLLPATVSQATQAEQPTRSVMIVVGAPGEEDYAKTFRESAERWRAVCESNGSKVHWIDGTQASPDQETVQSDRDRILQWIDQDPSTEHWLILIGHGTSDRDATKFNLRGPDLAADVLAKSIGKQPSRWLIVHCGSSSAPFINALSGPNRVVITATKSGAEQNYARFGEYLSQTISDPKSDLDHDHSVSILEAFLAASSRVAQFYANEDRLASEQALLDDNGDGRGTPAVFYRGSRPIKAPADGLKLDGSLASRMIITSNEPTATLTAAQTDEIEKLENQIEALRHQKSDLSEPEYLAKLETLFLQIIQIRGIQ